MAGRKPYEPTEEARMRVSLMAAAGFSQEVICSQTINPQTGNPIDKKTLEKHFREELDNGMSNANALVTQSLFKKATGNGPQSVTACIFWLKCKAGWIPKEGMELTGKDGQPLPGTPSLTPAEFEKLAKKLAQDV